MCDQLTHSFQPLNPILSPKMRIAHQIYLTQSVNLSVIKVSLGDCVNGLIDEVDRTQAVNEEILRTAEAMAKIGKDLG